MANRQNKKPIPKAVPKDKQAIPGKPAAQDKPLAQGKINAKPHGAVKTKSSLNIKLALLLGLMSFIVYANTLKNGYVLDDDSVMTENSIVTKGISGIHEIMTTPYHRGFFITSNDLYRPLSLVMFAVEYQLFGLNPTPNHLLNIIVFALGVILLFLFLDKLFERKKTAVAFIAALLFALHPLHTEVVANIKSRDELLCFFFVFLSLNIFIKYIEKGKPAMLAAGCLCFLLSILSKETVITFLAVIPLIFFFYRDENKKRSVYITIGITLMAAIAIAVRISVLSAYNANGIADINYADNELALKSLPFSSRIATAIFILGNYIKLIFVPYPLVCDYAYATIPFYTFGNPLVLLSLCFYIFLAVFSAWRLIKNHKDPYAFGILFFLVTISLFSNIVFLIGAVMGERFMFFGLAGFCLVAALLIEKLAGKTTGADSLAIIKNPKILAVLIPVCLAYACITISRNKDWESNFTLYSADIKKSPNSGKLNFFLGTEYQKVIADNEKDPVKQAGIRKEGIKFLQKAVAVDTDFPEAESNLGNAYYCLNLYDSAEVHERRAIEKNPINTVFANNLANVYYFTKKYRQSIELSKKSIAMKPEYVNSYGNLGRCYLALQRVDSAIYYSYKGIAVNPGYNFPYEILAYAYKAAGNADSVKKYVEITRKVKPGFNL